MARNRAEADDRAHRPVQEVRMPHILDPKRLSTDEDYCAALDELEDLMAADPDTPRGRRFDELASLIEAYERWRPASHLDAPPR